MYNMKNIVSEYQNKISEYISLIELHDNRLFKLKDINLNQLKETLHKNVILGIYTCWENFIRDIIFDSCILKFHSVFLSFDFWQKVLPSIFEKGYTKKPFIESLNKKNTYLTKELVCSSNNMNYKEVKRLFKILGICTDTYLSDAIKYSKIMTNKVENMQAIIPFRGDELTREAPNVTVIVNTAIKYIDSLVEYRNEIAHAYKLDEFLNAEQLRLYAEFVILLIDTIYKMLASYIVSKEYLNPNSKIAKVTKLDAIHLEGGQSQKNPAVIEINYLTNGKERIKDKEFWIYDIKKSHCIEIKNEIIMRNEKENRCRIIPNNKKCYLTLVSGEKIEKSREYVLAELSSLDEKKPTVTLN